MTAACADEAVLCDEKMVKNSSSSSSPSSSSNTAHSTVTDVVKIERDDSKKMNCDNIQLDNEKDETTTIKTQSCSRQLEIYLESRGLVHTWDDHEYTCNGEVASAASSSSLESHELISDANSSGYNSSSIDCIVKCKRDSDSLSASSRSDCGESNCPTMPISNNERRNMNSNVLKIDVDELERSMNQIMRIKSQCAESRKTNDASGDGDVVEEVEEEKVIVPEEGWTGEIYEQDERINFHEAVRMGDAKRVAELVAGGFIQDLDEPNWNVSGDPPLLVAATNHSLPVLSVLLSSGCNPGVRSPRGETALHRAILNGGPGNVMKFVEKLLEYGCSPGVKEAGGGLTALHIVARQLSHAQSLRSHHNHNYDMNEALETLSILARAGAVNDKDHQGRTALHILASSTIFDNNHKSEIKSIVRILLDAGADPTLTNDRGETALHESLECGALNTAILLMPHTPIGIVSRYGETPLHVAARKNYIEIVGKLLANGENPSVQDVGGNTALHLASARGFHQIVSHIVTSPLAQLEKINDEGLTALQVAAESGFGMAVRLLLKAGADPSLMANCTTLHHRHPDISTIIDHELTRRRQLAT